MMCTKPVISVAALCAFLCSAAFSSRGAQATSEPPPKPNFLIIVADDLGFGDVGFNGGKVIQTPNLDRLADTGVKLNDFRACPMCSPTRAGLLTGRWPLRFGMMRAVVPPWSTNGLPQAEKTMPELLASAGYEQRGIIGKWHLGHARKEFLPLSQGFTSFYGHYNGAIDYFDHTREGEKDWHRNDEVVREEGYATDLLGAEAVRFIEKAPKGKPWLLYLPFNAPHSPFQAKQEDLDKYAHLKLPDRRKYAAMVDSMDQAIGKVLGTLEKRPDATNTLVLFFSDNGGILRVGSNGQWRGGKLGVYEGGTRVAAAIRWPAGGLTGGKSFDGRIGYIDVLPTLLAVAGVKAPDNLDGTDFMPALTGQAKLPDRRWFSYIHQNPEAQASVHDGAWKLVARGDFFTQNPSTQPQFELYNLEMDFQEANDVSAKNPEITAKLHKALRDFGALQKPGGTLYGVGREGFKAPRDWVITQ
jgi:arylsulfatase B